MGGKLSCYTLLPTIDFLFSTLLVIPVLVVGLCFWSNNLQFGDSQVISKAKLGEIVQATISSLASPDSETLPNQLILVGHGVGGDLDRLADLNVSKYALHLVVTSHLDNFL